MKKKKRIKPGLRARERGLEGVRRRRKIPSKRVLVLD